MLIETLKKY